MDKFLCPEKFECDPSSAGSDKQWTHWLRTFENFLSAITTQEKDKFALLTNYVAPSVDEYTADCNTYESAITVLKELYVKPQNEIYARHVLATRRQEMNESKDTYLQILKHLSKDYNFTAVTAEQHRQSYIRDAFINGLHSKEIWSRLLENMTLTLDQVFEQVKSLKMTYKNSETYKQLYPSSAAAEKPISEEHNQQQ